MFGNGSMLHIGITHMCVIAIVSMLTIAPQPARLQGVQHRLLRAAGAAGEQRHAVLLDDIEGGAGVVVRRALRAPADPVLLAAEGRGDDSGGGHRLPPRMEITPRSAGSGTPSRRIRYHNVVSAMCAASPRVTNG